MNSMNDKTNDSTNDKTNDKANDKTNDKANGNKTKNSVFINLDSLFGHMKACESEVLQIVKNAQAISDCVYIVTNGSESW